MRTQFFALASVFAIAALSACAADTSGSSLASDDVDEDIVGESEEALAVTGNTGYFVVTRRDTRRCMSPLCGGVFVKRVNQTETVCADGTKQAECYVASYDFGPAGLDAAERADFENVFEGGLGLVRATMRSTRFNSVRLGKLRVSEAWKGAGEVPAAAGGRFMRIADNGTRCIQAPCPSTTAYTLNTTAAHTLLNLDLDAVPASPDEVSAARAALGTSTGILVAGGLAIPRCLPSVTCGPFVSADEFYLRVVHTKPASTACGVRGGIQCKAGEYCSFPLAAQCGAADGPGACAPRPDACIEIFKPVCGCDGRTYSNSCMAANAGVSVARDGSCR